jgi:hypothetical protein
MSPSRRTGRKTVLAVTAAVTVGVILVVTAVVHSRGSSGQDAPTATGQQGGQNLTRLGHDLAQCLRAHGYRQIADPVVTSDGGLDFGSQGNQIKSAMRALGRACHAQATALKGPGRRPPTPAELHQLVLFAQCMRQRGVPDWPDPRPDGTFPLNQRLMQIGKRGLLGQLGACRHLNPEKGIPASPSSSSGGGKSSTANG